MFLTHFKEKYNPCCQNKEPIQNFQSISMYLCHPPSQFPFNHTSKIPILVYTFFFASYKENSEYDTEKKFDSYAMASIAKTHGCTTFINVSLWRTKR